MSSNWGHTSQSKLVFKHHSNVLSKMLLSPALQWGVLTEVSSSHLSVWSRRNVGLGVRRPEVKAFSVVNQLLWAQYLACLLLSLSIKGRFILNVSCQEQLAQENVECWKTLRSNLWWYFSSWCILQGIRTHPHMWSDSHIHPPNTNSNCLASQNCPIRESVFQIRPLLK